MEKVSILGVDLAKASFTVCGLDEKGKKVLTKEYRTDAFKKFYGSNSPLELFYFVLTDGCAEGPPVFVEKHHPNLAFE